MIPSEQSVKVATFLVNHNWNGEYCNRADAIGLIATALDAAKAEQLEVDAKVLDKTVLDLQSVLVDNRHLREVQMAMIDRCLEDAAAIRGGKP